MDFHNRVAVVAGGSGLIGTAIADTFRELGAAVCIIDQKPNAYFSGDLSDKNMLDTFAEKVIRDYGRVDFLVHCALPLTKGIQDCTYEEFNHALSVGVTSAFYLAKTFLTYFSSDASIIHISSTRDSMSQPNTESYTAAKGGLSALTHALAISLGGHIRVNAISPGWIDKNWAQYGSPDTTQHPAGRVGKPSDIADMVIFLCSDKASFITGETITIDGGMSKQMIYHDDFGWSKAKGT